MIITEAFRRYNATLKNVQWSVCAENSKDELVVSIWEHHFEKPYDNTVKCKDNVSRWSGHGNRELRVALNKAKENNPIIRAVIARTENPKAFEAGQDASKFKNTYSVREDWIGNLEVWD